MRGHVYSPQLIGRVDINEERHAASGTPSAWQMRTVRWALVATFLLVLAATTIPTTVATVAPRTAQTEVSLHTADPCPASDTEMSFVNKASLDAYGAVTLNGAASITPADLVNVSKPIADYPVDPNDPSGRTHYFCDSHWTGSGAGNFWVSIGQPIVGLPTTQPTVTSPYRWGEIEFGRPAWEAPQTSPT